MKPFPPVVFECKKNKPRKLSRNVNYKAARAEPRPRFESEASSPYTFPPAVFECKKNKPRE